jgi:hypothetical protein
MTCTMKPSRLYWAYQLLVDSELELSELGDALASHEPAAVSVRLGDVGHGADGGRWQVGPFAWCALDELWLEVPRIGRFLVQHGSRIVVQMQPGIDPDSVRLFLLGPVFAALLTQRRLLVLQGSAIGIGDHGLACVGSSGIGKSTLAAGFLKRGYGLIADDVLAIDTTGRALPGLPRLKLWQDSATRLGVATAPLQRLRPGLNRYHYPVGPQSERQPIPVRWVYVLERSAVTQVQFTAAQGLQRFMPLLHSTYRRPLVDAMGYKAAHLQRVGALADNAHVVHVQRPRGFDLDYLIDAMLADIQGRA